MQDSSRLLLRAGKLNREGEGNKTGWWGKSADLIKHTFHRDWLPTGMRNMELHRKKTLSNGVLIAQWACSSEE